MAKVELLTDDVVEAFCKMLEPGIRKDALPREDCNKYGVDVLHRKSDQAQIMFHFVTLEDFEINLVMDLIELQNRGKEYLEHLYGLMCDQVEQARTARIEQEKQGVMILPSNTNDLPNLKKSVAAHNEVLH